MPFWVRDGAKVCVAMGHAATGDYRAAALLIRSIDSKPGIVNR
jgi:hypothetical protein